MALNLFELYEAVSRDELAHFLETRQIEKEYNKGEGIEKLLNGYSIQGLQRADSLNFNCIELRNAYLFLYSTSHSHMVLDALCRYKAHRGCMELLDRIDSAGNVSEPFNITSLGGGPGSDPVGILVFPNRFGYLPRCVSYCVRVVDAYYEWERPLRNLMRRFVW